MRRLLLLPLLASSCSVLAGSSISEGDRQFRLGYYEQAYVQYADAYSIGARGDLVEKLEETRYRVVASHARHLLHTNEPRQAVEILEVADRIRPGHPWTDELYRRSANKLSEDLSDAGREFLQSEEPIAALEAYTAAVSWNPENPAARAGYEKAKALADARFDRGERLFLLGLRELEDGNDLRARTALTAAADLWEDDTRVNEHLSKVIIALALESRRQGESYLSAGLPGHAWLSLRDAARLQPGDQELAGLVKEAERQLAVQKQLNAADHSIRIGDFDLATAQLAEARSTGGDTVAGEVANLERSVVRERNNERYARARALELDSQIVRSTGLYRAILQDGGDGLGDVHYRLSVNLERLASAERSYNAAMRALEAGDTGRAEDQLLETVRHARDFKDAYSQLQRLL